MGARGPKPTQPCGTVAAARRHERHGEPVCDACRAALRAHNAEQYERRKTTGK